MILKRGWEILKIHGGFFTGILHRTKWWIFQPRFMTLEGHRRSVWILSLGGIFLIQHNGNIPWGYSMRIHA
jgi:hypothetical protein